jgi:hypothetical protein
MLNEFEYLIATRNEVKKPEKRLFADKLALIKESIQKVKIAYEIITFPHFKDWGIRDSIKEDLSRDRDWRERDSVELNDAELEIVRRLCQTPRYELHKPVPWYEVTEEGDIKTRPPYQKLQPQIPFNPQKRVYHYSEVIGNTYPSE